MTRALQIQSLSVASLLDATSERERLALLTDRKGVLDDYLSLFEGSSHAEEAWSAVLSWKGTAHRALLDQRETLLRVEDEAVRAQLDTLAAVRRRIAHLALKPDPDPNAKVDLAALTVEKEALERELARTSREYRREDAQLEADLESICARIPDGRALVDLVHYRRAIDGEAVPSYAAFVVAPGCSSVTRVELGASAPLHEAVHAYRTAMEASSRTTDVLGARVRRQVWDPLVPSMGASRRVLVVPDGELAMLSFAGLPTESGGYLLEDWTIAYASSGSDLLRPATKSDSVDRALLVGGIDYATAAGDASTVIASNRRRRHRAAPCGAGSFEPLPGTQREIDSLQPILADKGISVQMLGSGQATEDVVARAVVGKQIVHLATHGFFARAGCGSALALSSTETARYNPLVLSGVALAGANRAPEGHDVDGIWTAEEIATLDLRAAELVVLSGCETGLGTVADGQGVLGLRHATTAAGAQSLVLSLWKVQDEATQELMVAFYRALLDDPNRDLVSALRSAQLEVLAANRATGWAEPSSWAAFVPTSSRW